MDPWQERYGDKRITARRAAALVKSGDIVRFPIGKPPIPILKALAERAGELQDVTLIQCFPSYAHEIWNDPQLDRSFRRVVDYVGAGCREGMRRHDIDFLVEETEPLLVSTPPPPEEERGTLEVIASFAASLIRDGDTVQMGVGGISESIGLFLTDRNDLGIHSEIMTVGHVELVRRGVATGRYKTLHPGRAVAAMIVGAANLEYVNDNPLFELYSVLYTNRIP